MWADGAPIERSYAGVAMQPEDDPHHARQPQSLVFRLSNVDVPRFRALPREEKRRLALHGIAKGELFWESLSFMSTPGGTDAICLMSRIRGIDPLDPHQATKAERIGRAQVKSIVAFLKREVPGFEKAIVANMAPRVGVRETRRIVGAHTLTEQEILDRTRFEDSIALGCGPMDIHEANGTGVQLFMPPAPFEIPMRCLLPVDLSGLIVTGRAISATRSANGGARHMATAMALGQAAGTIGLVSTRENIATRAVPVGRVQAILREDDAVVTTAECLARAAANGSTEPLVTGRRSGENITLKKGGA
jgi:hypothetical protein